MQKMTRMVEMATGFGLFLAFLTLAGTITSLLTR